jgi:hypothetical protein
VRRADRRRVVGVALLALLAAACTEPPADEVLRNEAFAFVALPRIPAPEHPNAIVIADLDGDGDRDLVVPGVVEAAAIVIENVDGDLVARPPQALTAGVIDAVALPGPGPVRLAFSLGGGDAVEILEVDPATLLLRRVASLPLRGAFALAAGDLDGDGDADLVASGMSEGLVVPYYAGDAGFSRGRAVALGKPQALAVADIAGDARLEILVVQGAASTASVLAFDDAVVGHVILATTPTASWPTSILATDLDGDARLDVIGAANLADSLFVGSFTDGSLSFTDLAAGHGAVDAAAGDLDGDGTNDLVVTNKFEDTITIFASTGGTLTPAMTYPTGGGPTPIELADLDGDGLLDIALTNGFSNDVEIFLATPAPSE